MNLKKLVILSCLIFTTSCSFNIAKENVDKVKEIFDEQLTNLYELYKANGKEFLSELSFEKAEDMLNNMLYKIPEDKRGFINKGIEKGVTLIEGGKEILADKLSIDVSLEGAQEEISAFLESLVELDAKISVQDVKIEKTDDNYKLDCTIDFFYNANNQAQEGSFSASFEKSKK